MKKVTRFVQVLVLFAAMLFATGTWAQTTLLSEGFNTTTIPTGWSQIYELGSTSWSFGVVGGYGGNPSTTHSGAYNTYLFTTGDVRTILVTPSMNFGTNTFAQLSFWHTQPYWSPDQDTLSIVYRTSPTGPWIRIAGWQSSITAWTQETITLPNVGATYQVGFRGYATYGYGVSLDDVLITGMTPQIAPPPTVTIGNGTLSSSGYPYYTYYMDNRTQMIYLASELTAAGASAGSITNFGCNILTASSYLMNGFIIKMTHTPASTLNGFDPTSSWTTVYNTNMTISTIGWQNILFTTPFNWNGTDNILMEICFDNSAYGTSNVVQCTSTSPNYLTTYRYQDVSSGGGCTLTSPTNTYNRPNARFSFAPGATGMFMGTITNCLTSAPIANATLTVQGNNFTTNASGFYLIQIGVGTLNVTVSAPGYISKTVPVTVTQGNVTTLNVCLDPLPALISGVITNCVTGAPIVGARVFFTAATTPPGNVAPPTGITDNPTYTSSTGAFTVKVPGGGTGYLYADKAGWDQAATLATMTVIANSTYTQNLCLNETTNPPSNVVAALNTAQTQVNVSWGLPIGDYMLVYDDGVAENFTVWASAGNSNAVKFTPLAYPVTLKGAKINIGQIANYPTGANPINKQFTLSVVGVTSGGLPNSADVIVPAFDVNTAVYGWNDFTIPATTINAPFCIVMTQKITPPNAPGLAIDTTTQQLRSYSKFGTTAWIPASGNFLIRAVVAGTGGPLMAAKAPTGNTVTASAVPGAIYQYKPGTHTGTEGIAQIISLDSPDALVGYQVWRLKQGEQTTPAVWTTIGTPTTTSIVDPSWPSLPCGPYMWAVKAQYSNNRWSNAAFSNVIGKCWTANVTINIDLSCDTITPEGAQVFLTNAAYPDTVYTAIAGPTGVVNFPTVWKGTYNLLIRKWDFTNYVSNGIVIMADMTINATLLQIKAPPTGLDVDPRSNWATWTPPLYQIPLLNETWSSGNFTANQWVVTGGNWSVSGGVGNPAPSAMFYYSPTVTSYSQDITSKNLVGQHSPVLRLKYDIYLDNFATSSLEQMAVELWDGTNWISLKNYDNANGSIPWTSEDIDILAYTDITFKIRFRAYGENSYTINNWNVDNIQIVAQGPPGSDPCLLGYNFYLNNILDATIPPMDEPKYWIPPSHVHYGTTYNACVLAIYGSGYSTTSCDVFTSKWLYPPTNLQGVPVEDAAYLTWEKPTMSDEYPDNMDAATVRPRTSMPVATSEYSPTVSTQTITESPLALWDVQFSWPVSTAGIPNGQVGVEIKDQNIYTSVWSGGPAWFAKYSLTGSLVEVFNISGVTAVRDLASDGTYFYGAPASTSLFKMDFTAHTLVSTISAATAVRHIAWDPLADNNNGGFWCGDWSTMALIKMNGALIANASISTSAAYGDAYDNASTGGPYLWNHSQDGAPALTLTQFKINGNAIAATGLTHVVSGVPGVGGAAIAGGLCSGAVNGKFCLIGASQDATNTIFALELTGNIPNPTTGTPPGLVGYNVYRDGTFHHFVPSPDTLYYYDMNLDPNTYCYDVSAKYDLTTYGFPGQFDESLPAFSGPVCVPVIYGIPIPWVEPWNSGTFSYNDWTTTGGNWSVNSGFGNPAPTADFSWQPIVHNYEQSIVTPTLSAAAWTCAELWLDFDLKLIDRNNTGEENLTVEVYTNGAWSKKAEFSNEGSFDWTPEHIDIKAIMGKAFKIRFKANGVNSDDILHWYVDNIHVYGVCKPPVDLAASQSHFVTTLTWGAPECPSPATLMEFIFDDGGWENGHCYYGGYVGWFGNYFPIDAALTGVLTEMKVYFVDNGTGAPQDLSLDIYDNAQTLVGSTPTFPVNVTDTWINVPINNIPFSGPFYGMVKWNMQSAQSYFLACDEDGPNAALNLGYQYDGTTWTNDAHVFFMRATAMVNGELKTFQYSSDGRPLVINPNQTHTAKVNRSGIANLPVRGFTSSSDSSTLIGYNIWRTDETGTGAFTKLNSSPLTALTYVDTYPSTLLNGLFQYYVESLFEDSFAPGQVLCNSPSDTITVQFPAVGINDLNGNSISLYPNPATDYVNIVATSELKNVEVLNFLGQTLKTQTDINAKSMKLDVSSLQSGVYFVKVTAAGGVKTTKVTVTH